MIVISPELYHRWLKKSQNFDLSWYVIHFTFQFSDNVCYCCIYKNEVYVATYSQDMHSTKTNQAIPQIFVEKKSLCKL